MVIIKTNGAGMFVALICQYDNTMNEYMICVFNGLFVKIYNVKHVFTNLQLNIALAQCLNNKRMFYIQWTHSKHE